ncbi:Small GTPase superfamily Ras type [Penicillium paradoxum]|uniref:Small GTPase superfamily Ras type n=1 Tax=Penicillium paradoxum TaxID=176176 RepID=UPI0025493C1B|nr:Small GTPase superfamily Ras type [Penicillium paradoxum]KAJ5773695.1 Small GTPase superfamily Ras type [Penicillium paradoxum]
MSSSLEAKIVVLGAQGVGKTALVERYCKNTFNPAAPSTIGASFVTKRVLDSTSDTIVRLQIWDTAGQERFRSMSRLYYRGAQAVLLCYDVSASPHFHISRCGLSFLPSYLFAVSHICGSYITDHNSFQEMAGWLRELRKNITPNDDGTDSLIIHVVGTKSDIVADDPSRRGVPFELTIAYVAEQLYPTQASTPPPTATAGMGSLGFGSSVFGGSGGSASNASASAAALQSPDSKRSSAFWGQEIGWDCCHEISARDGEGIDEVFRVITRKLVEQRNRRDTELALSIAGTTAANGVSGPFGPGFVEGTGSFRLGHGDKRRSWLGLTTPGVNVEGADEVQIMHTARNKGRCC